VNTDDPWGWGRSLEWATSCPPPRHNFTSLPRIRSESPAFDLHHPELALAEYGATEDELADTSVDSGEDTGRVEELVARVHGTSDDPVVGQEDRAPSQSPEPRERDQ
jgi:cytochrome c oxidase subunit 1